MRKIDRYVARLQAKPVGAYRSPKTMYVCRICGYRTTRIGRAFAHSHLHGPWEQTGSGAAAYELKLSAQAELYRLNHPRGTRTAQPLALVAL
jgi:predicted GNAT superfamily acetyltransferase